VWKKPGEKVKKRRLIGGEMSKIAYDVKNSSFPYWKSGAKIYH
jgi:hypothetical protein